MSENQYPQLSSPREHSSFPREVQALACGKAIIVGEHAVVYGSRAVAMPLQTMHFHFALSPQPTFDGKPVQIHLKLAAHELSPRIQGVVLDAMQLLGIPPFSLNGRSSSALPIGAGLGSSATLCVAVLRALSDSCGISLSKAQLARYANELEKRFHGNPSGLDTAVVAYEQCVLFARAQPIQGIEVQAPSGGPWDFALIDSHVRASTLAMIRIAEPFFKGAAGDRHVASFDQISLLVRDALESGAAAEVGRAMNNCDELLVGAGVVPEAMREMIDASRKLGVLGAKTTGAGGGGMILALLDPASAQEQFAALKTEFHSHPVYRVRLSS